LRRAEIEPYGWVIHASLAKSGTKDPLLVVRTRLKLPYIQQVRLQLASRTWLVPGFREASIGVVALFAMTK